MWICGTKLGVEMAKVVVNLKIMPMSVEISLEKIKEILKKEIEKFDGEVLGDLIEEPVAFGLKAVKIKFAYGEEKGTTDDLEEKISAYDEIQSVEVLSVSRALG